jgi:hypothetical protein
MVQHDPWNGLLPAVYHAMRAHPLVFWATLGLAACLPDIDHIGGSGREFHPAFLLVGALLCGCVLYVALVDGLRYWNGLKKN